MCVHVSVETREQPCMLQLGVYHHYLKQTLQYPKAHLLGLDSHAVNPRVSCLHLPSFGGCKFSNMFIFFCRCLGFISGSQALCQEGNNWTFFFHTRLIFLKVHGHWNKHSDQDQCIKDVFMCVHAANLERKDSVILTLMDVAPSGLL